MFNICKYRIPFCSALQNAKSVKQIWKELYLTFKSHSISLKWPDLIWGLDKYILYPTSDKIGIPLTHSIF